MSVADHQQVSSAAADRGQSPAAEASTSGVSPKRHHNDPYAVAATPVSEVSSGSPFGQYDNAANQMLMSTDGSGGSPTSGGPSQAMMRSVFSSANPPIANDDHQINGVDAGVGTTDEGPYSSAAAAAEAGGEDYFAPSAGMPYTGGIPPGGGAMGGIGGMWNGGGGGPAAAAGGMNGGYFGAPGGHYAWGGGAFMHPTMMMAGRGGGGSMMNQQQGSGEEGAELDPSAVEGEERTSGDSAAVADEGGAYRSAFTFSSQTVIPHAAGMSPGGNAAGKSSELSAESAPFIPKSMKATGSSTPPPPPPSGAAAPNGSSSGAQIPMMIPPGVPGGPPSLGMPPLGGGAFGPMGPWGAPPGMLGGMMPPPAPMGANPFAMGGMGGFPQMMVPGGPLEKQADGTYSLAGNAGGMKVMNGASTNNADRDDNTTTTTTSTPDTEAPEGGAEKVEAPKGTEKAVEKENQEEAEVAPKEEQKETETTSEEKTTTAEETSEPAQPTNAAFPPMMMPPGVPGGPPGMMMGMMGMSGAAGGAAAGGPADETPEDAEIYQSVCEQIEYYFTPENVKKDSYLNENMSPTGFAPLDVVADFNKVKRLTKDLAVVVASVYRSTKLILRPDWEGRYWAGLYPAVCERSRCTVILLNVDVETTQEQLQQLMPELVPYHVHRFQSGTVWYLTFPEPNMARTALFSLQEACKKEMPKVMVRIRTDNIDRGYGDHDEGPSFQNTPSGSGGNLLPGGLIMSAAQQGITPAQLAQQLTRQQNREANQQQQKEQNSSGGANGKEHHHHHHHHQHKNSNGSAPHHNNNRGGSNNNNNNNNTHAGNSPTAPGPAPPKLGMSTLPSVVNGRSSSAWTNGAHTLNQPQNGFHPVNHRASPPPPPNGSGNMNNGIRGGGGRGAVAGRGRGRGYGNAPPPHVFNNDGYYYNEHASDLVDDEEEIARQNQQVAPNGAPRPPKAVIPGKKRAPGAESPNPEAEATTEKAPVKYSWADDDLDDVGNDLPVMQLVEGKGGDVVSSPTQRSPLAFTAPPKRISDPAPSSHQKKKETEEEQEEPGLRALAVDDSEIKAFKSDAINGRNTVQQVRDQQMKKMEEARRLNQQQRQSQNPQQQQQARPQVSNKKKEKPFVAPKFDSSDFPQLGTTPNEPPVVATAATSAVAIVEGKASSTPIVAPVPSSSEEMTVVLQQEQKQEEKKNNSSSSPHPTELQVEQPREEKKDQQRQPDMPSDEGAAEQNSKTELTSSSSISPIEEPAPKAAMSWAALAKKPSPATASSSAVTAPAAPTTTSGEGSASKAKQQKAEAKKTEPVSASQQKKGSSNDSGEKKKSSEKKAATEAQKEPRQNGGVPKKAAGSTTKKEEPAKKEPLPKAEAAASVVESKPTTATAAPAATVAASEDPQASSSLTFAERIRMKQQMKA